MLKLELNRAVRFMKIRCRTLTLLILPIFICISCPASAQTDSLQAIFGSKTSLGEITIEAKHGYLENKNKILVYYGDVKATTSDNMTMSCQRVEVYYENTSGDKDGQKNKTNIDRLIASEDVKITKPDGSLLTAEKAEFIMADEKITLTGNPVFKHEDDSMQASKMIYDLKEDKIYLDDIRSRLINKGKSIGR